MFNVNLPLHALEIWMLAIVIIQILNLFPHIDGNGSLDYSIWHSFWSFSYSQTYF